MELCHYEIISFCPRKRTKRLGAAQLTCGIRNPVGVSDGLMYSKVNKSANFLKIFLGSFS
jgi:hypothetical protein